MRESRHILGIQDTTSLSVPFPFFPGDAGSSVFTPLAEKLEASAVKKRVDNSRAFFGPVWGLPIFRNKIFPKAPNTHQIFKSNGF